MKINWKEIIYLIASLLLVILSPLVGSLIRWDGSIPGYGDFPTQKSTIPIPGFSPTIFWIGLILQLILYSFVLFPQILGFKQDKVLNQDENLQKVPLPPWFWFGLIVFIISLSIFWAEIPILELDKALDPYMFFTVWWGFIFMLDGIVFYRRNGKSLLASKPQTLLLLSIVSSVGWFIFEYLNFFVLENWYYPNNKVFSNYGNIVWYMLSYTIIFPFIFEFYHLFQTIPWLRFKYAYGPKITLSRSILYLILLIGILNSVLMGLFPHELFFTIWLNPIFIIGSILGLTGNWTLFNPIKEGNWTNPLFIGIAMLISGLLWEFVNFGSEKFYGYLPLNPSYWKYSIPYVNYVHLPFSEMPILGYFGYIPYGWICWLQWTLACKTFGINESIELD